MPKLRPLILCTAALLAVAWTGALLRKPDSALSKAELAGQDLLAEYGRRTPANEMLIFLAVDSDSINLNAEQDLEALFGIKDVDSAEGKALSLMSEHWPWSREVYALLLDRLMAAGAKVVVFDMLYPTAGPGDDAFRAALAKYAGRVVVGSNVNVSDDELGGQTISLTTPSPTLIPPQNDTDDRVGFVNFWPDADGAIRQVQFQTSMAQLMGGAPDLTSLYTSLGAQAVRKLGRGKMIPQDTLARPFRYTDGPQQGFRPRSVFEVFVPEYWQRNFRAGAAFEGAVVVVGAAGNWQHDQHPTPLGVMAGPEIQLNTINAALHGEFLRPLTGWALLAILAAFGAAGFAVACTSPLARFALLLVLAGAWAGLSLWAFNGRGWLLPLASPAIILAAIWTASMVYDLVALGAERIRLRLHLREQQIARETLAGANAELERRVAERTAELTTSNTRLHQLTEELTVSNDRLSRLTEELTCSNTRLTGLVEEKSVLLKEIHHRVKNNMQVISSLMNLQSDHIKDPAALQVFADSRNRVRSMALIHEKLYQSTDLANIHFGEYLKALTGNLMASFTNKRTGVRLTIEADEIMLGVDAAVPCGLIVNELVTNCFKYAFTPGTPGEIGISLKRLPEKRLQLSVADNGVGFPKEIDFRNTESLGLQLVNTLTEQLDGEVAMRNGSGTTFEISFPEPS